MATKDQAISAFTALEAAKTQFQAAIEQFRKVYDPKTVGLDYWAEGLDDTMFEIDEDMQTHFGL
jgi:hypothetical protein